MWKNVSMAEFQRDIDEGWVEFCDCKIAHLRKLYLGVHMEHSKVFLERQINHFKVLKRMR